MPPRRRHRPYKRTRNSMMQRLDHIKHFALDLDGTLYLGERLFNVTLPFLARLDELHIGRTFFTNNSSRSTRQYVEHLRAMGIDADETDVHTSAHATIEYLTTQRPQV